MPDSTGSEPLVQVIDALEKLNIPYVVVGSFASTYWGRPRATHDADLVVEIDPKQAAPLSEILTSEFYAPSFVIEEAARKRDPFNVIHIATGFKVDLWVRRDADYDRMAFYRHLTATIFGRDMEIISPEDVILSKLRWYRSAPMQDRQLQDALEVYQAQAEFMDDDYLDRWAAELGVEDLLDRIRKEASTLR